MSNPWYLETWVMIQLRALLSLEIHPLGINLFMVNFSECTGRTLLRVYEHLNLLQKAEADEKQLLSLEEAMPEPYAQLVEVYKNLEKHYRDMQDIEFTIERGQLWMLQTRNGKRTAEAALKLHVI